MVGQTEERPSAAGRTGLCDELAVPCASHITRFVEASAFDFRKLVKERNLPPHTAYPFSVYLSDVQGKRFVELGFHGAFDYGRLKVVVCRKSVDMFQQTTILTNNADHKQTSLLYFMNKTLADRAMICDARESTRKSP